jgi:hypothetical protein
MVSVNGVLLVSVRVALMVRLLKDGSGVEAGSIVQVPLMTISSPATGRAPPQLKALLQRAVPLNVFIAEKALAQVNRKAARNRLAALAFNDNPSGAPFYLSRPTKRSIRRRTTVHMRELFKRKKKPSGVLLFALEDDIRSKRG